MIDEYGVQDYEMPNGVGVEEEIIETGFDEGLDFDPEAEEEYYEGEMDSDVKAFEDGDLMEYSDVNFDNQVGFKSLNFSLQIFYLFLLEPVCLF
mmetsp:Transcript_7485/g.11401  ORF Transcript_7485/g.11401 Transcript_7485/m.11401 type:complete len:94 (-) Transcript_7485:127-408(-)